MSESQLETLTIVSPFCNDETGQFSIHLTGEIRSASALFTNELAMMLCHL